MRIVCFIVVLLVGVFSALPIAGAGGGHSDANGEGDSISVSVGREGSGRPVGRSGCSWVSLDDSGSSGVDVASGAQTSRFGGRDHALFRRVCGGVRSLVWVPFLTVEGDLLPAAVDEMRRRLHYPVAVFEPVDVEFGWMYVQVPVDFRTVPGSWVPVVVSAAVDGPPGFDPWVTVTATPDELWFASGDPADPGPVAGCGGEAAVAVYVAEVPGACSYTYRNASSTVVGGVFAAELGIVWDVMYESSDGPGTLLVDPTISPAPVEVAEIKALVTCTGPDPRQGGC